MIRSIRLVALSVALPIVGAACWLEVPNLHSTGGGYPPDPAATSEVEPGHEAPTAADAASETSAATPEAEPPGSDRDSSRTSRSRQDRRSPLLE